MKKLLLTVLVTSMLLSGCGAAARSETVAAPMEMPMAEYGGTSNTVMDSGYAPAAEPMVANENDGDSTGGTLASSTERMVIHNAHIEITVLDPQETSTKIQRMADEYGGFVIQSNINRVSQYIDGYGYYYLSQAEINFRVPADRLNDAMDFVRSQVNDADLDIANESITGQDVTKEYTDLNSQLVSLEAAKETLLGFMDEATKTEDVMSIYREIQSLDTEIERIKGEMKYYEESSSYSAIDVLITQSEDELDQIRKDLQDKIDQKQKSGWDIANWQPVLVAKQALETLVNFLTWLGSVLIWIILFVAPVLLIIVAPIYLLIRFLNRKKRKQQKTEE